MTSRDVSRRDISVHIQIRWLLMNQWIHLMMCFTHFCHITKPMLKQNKKHFLFQLFYLMINEQHASKQSIAKQYFIL